MRINYNATALNTFRQLAINNNNSNKSLERLSSGLRINRASDDAAGLAISEKMQFKKSNLLSQAATAMLAQANLAPEGVLQLLRA